MEEGRVPVFVFPTEVEWVVAGPAQSAPRTMVTIYNPYDYPMHYKVLCTSPHCYSIGEPEGTLGAKCCKDIVIRSKNRQAVGTVDKLRFEMRRIGESELHGSKDVALRSVAEATPQLSSSLDPSAFHGMSKQPSVTIQDRPPQPQPPISATWLALLSGIACALALLAPTQGDSQASHSMVPHQLHLTLPQKLVAAYILGIVTTLLVRPQV